MDVARGSLAATAGATPIVEYDAGTGYATGILDLAVGGRVYDAEFVGGSYVSVYVSGIPWFLGDEPGAAAAASEIVNVLNAEPVVPEIAAGSSESLFVPHALVFNPGATSTSLSEQRGHSTDADPWQAFGDFVGSVTTDFSDAPYSWLYVRFTPVPEPGTMALFGLGIAGGLGVLVRRRRNR